MSSLYDINAAIEQLLTYGFDEECVDAETGEVYLDKAQTRLEELNVAAEEKLENIALFIKSIDHDISAIKEEEKKLAARKHTKERKREWLVQYITRFMQSLDKMKFEKPRCALSFRKSEALEIVDENRLRAYIETHGLWSLQREQPPKLEIAKIKKAVKDGEEIQGVVLVEKLNLQIK